MLGARAGRDVLGELVQLFLGSAPGQLAALDLAARHDDRPGLASLAHHLRGTAGSIGAVLLESLAARLEEHPVPDVEGMALIAALHAELPPSAAALRAAAAA